MMALVRVGRKTICLLHFLALAISYAIGASQEDASFAYCKNANLVKFQALGLRNNNLMCYIYPLRVHIMLMIWWTALTWNLSISIEQVGEFVYLHYIMYFNYVICINVIFWCPVQNLDCPKIDFSGGDDDSLGDINLRTYRYTKGVVVSFAQVNLTFSKIKWKRMTINLSSRMSFNRCNFCYRRYLSLQSRCL